MLQECTRMSLTSSLRRGGTRVCEASRGVFCLPTATKWVHLHSNAEQHLTDDIDTAQRIETGILRAYTEEPQPGVWRRPQQGHGVDGTHGRSLDGLHWRYVKLRRVHCRAATDDAAALGSPLFLVKARIQAYSPALPVGAQHYYRNSFDALRTILKSDGVLGLWRGVNAAILRTAMVSSLPSSCVRIGLISRARRCSFHRTTWASRS